MDLASARSAWTDLLGDDCVLSPAAATQVFGACTTGAQRRLAGALRPRESSAIAPIVRIAARYRVPLYPISTGRNWGYGTALPVRDDCIVLDLSAMRRIREFDADTGVVTVEPGVTQGMLAEFLDGGRHPFMVPVTGAGPSASLLGNALERGFGITPVADHFGAVLALEAVLPDGSAYRSPLVEMAGNSGGPGFKWGIGPYLDGLFAQGGFGVVTAMTIALARRPESVKAVLFGLADEHLAEGVTAVREILRRLPGIVGGINLMNAHRVLSMAIPYPGHRRGTDGVLPAAVIDQLSAAHKIQAWTGFGTLYGSRRVVKAAQWEMARLLRPHVRQLMFVKPATIRRANRLRRPLPGQLGALGRKLQLLEAGLELVEGRPNQTALPLAYWRSGRRHDLSDLDPARDGCGLAWYAPLVPMTPAHVQRFVEFVTERMRAYRLEPLITLTTLSDRCFDCTVPLLFDRADPDATANARRCIAELLAAGHQEGFLPYRIGIDAMPWLASLGLEHAALGGRIKASLDPEGILAPDRYV